MSNPEEKLSSVEYLKESTPDGNVRVRHTHSEESAVAIEEDAHSCPPGFVSEKAWTAARADSADWFAKCQALRARVEPLELENAKLKTEVTEHREYGRTASERILELVRERAALAPAAPEAVKPPTCKTCGAALDVLGDCMATRLHADGRRWPLAQPEDDKPAEPAKCSCPIVAHSQYRDAGCPVHGAKPAPSPEAAPELVRNGVEVKVRWAVAPDNVLWLRHSKGPKQGHFWDTYGDDYQTEALARLAISEAPLKPGGPYQDLRAQLAGANREHYRMCRDLRAEVETRAKAEAQLAAAQVQLQERDARLAVAQRTADMCNERAEEFKRMGQQFEREGRKFFEQSCKNLERAEKAEREYADAEQAGADWRDERDDARQERDAAVALLKSPETREALAALAHEQWSGWMRYLFEKCEDMERRGPGVCERIQAIPPWAVERWQRQMSTPYAALPEEEKESDRKEADRVLALLAGPK